MSLSNVESPGGGFPPPDPNDGGLPDWFNPSVPNQYLNPYAYPGNDIMSKLYRMMEWMKDNPSNKTAPEEFLLYLSNLESKGVFAQHPDLLNKIMGMQVCGTSLVYQIVTMEIERNFFSGGDKNSFFSFIQSLFGGSDALCQDVQNCLSDWNADWNNFVKRNTGPDGKPIYSEYQFDIVASGIWGQDILGVNVEGWERDMRVSMISDLSQLSVYKNNPMILLMLLIFLLTDSSSQDQLGGYGSTSNWLKDRTSDMDQITSGWGTPFASGDDAMNWIKKIQDLLFQTDHSPLASGIKDQIDSQLGSILNMQAKGPPDSVHPNGPPLFMPDGKTPVTIQDLADGYTDTSGVHHDPDAGALQAALNDFLPNPKGVYPDPPPAVPVEFQTIMNNLKSAGSSFSDQSQVVGTMISQLSSSSQQIDNMLNKFLNDTSVGIVGLEKACIQHQISS